ncbi:molybdenum cofactor guanylyltransferase [Salinicoccus siamensis]|uniref:Probable molybdenum cofactor guanylyltransferase n=1 Tax=Salinicoccus siamensis TaxID=381830 RepID=A0ABV5Z0D1_9STAP
MTGTIGIVMAGGNSTRFGEDKAFFEIDGKPMYRHIVDALEQSGVCDDIMVSTNSRLSGRFDDMPVKVDVKRFRDRGPLAGIYTFADAYPDKRLLIISCDTPYISPEWIRTLHEVALDDQSIVVTRSGDRLHPLVGIYQGGGLASDIERLLTTDRRSMKALFAERKTIEVDSKLYDIDVTSFLNINRKADLH